MTHVILGLLLVHPMTFYDILQLLDKGISLFYSSSAGSAKRALNVLLDRGEIEVAKEETTGRRRKTYAVTDAGRAAFRNWMLDEPQGGDLETAILSRIYFLGLMPAADRPQVLEGLLARVDEAAAALDAMEAQAKSQTEGARGSSSSDLERYALATLDYGQRAHAVSREWLHELIEAARTESGPA